MKIEYIRAGIPILSICGAIAFGLYRPAEYSQVATSVLSGAVGGYWGYSQAKRE